MKISSRVSLFGGSLRVLSVMMLAALGYAGTLSGTAQAITGFKCAYTADVSPGAQVGVCVYIGDHNGDHVPDVYPQITFYSVAGQDNGRPVSGSIFLYQCAGTGGSCAVIGSNRQDGPAFSRFFSGGWNYSLSTSDKPWSLGHTYKACGQLSTSSNFKVPTSSSLMCTVVVAGS